MNSLKKFHLSLIFNLYTIINKVMSSEVYINFLINNYKIKMGIKLNVKSLSIYTNYFQINKNYSIVSPTTIQNQAYLN